MASTFKLVKESNTTISKVYETLLERFGEPIHDQPATIGAADEGPDGKALWNDKPKADRNWSDPSVVREADVEEHDKSCTCNQCGGMMEMDGTTCSQCQMMPEGIDRSLEQLVMNKFDELFGEMSDIDINTAVSEISAALGIQRSKVRPIIVADSKKGF